MLTDRKPSVTRLRVFGSLAYHHIPRQFRGKFDPKGEKCIMVGYTRTGYRLWNPNNDKIKCARNVVFVENKTIRDWECDKEDDGNVRRRDNKNFVEIVENEISADNGVCIDEKLEEERQEEAGTSKIGREKKMPKRFDDCVMTSYVADVGVECPLNYKEVMACKEADEWKAAMQREREREILCTRMRYGN